MANNQSVRRHLDSFTRGRIIGKLEEGRSVTSVAAEFGIAHSIVSRLWRQFQTTGTAIQGFSSGRPRGTTPAYDRYRPEETGGRQREKSLDTRHRRLDDRYRVLPWPEDCTVVVCLHDALYDESRFSLSSDSHRLLIWRERGSLNHPSNIIERDRYGGRGVLVWGGIMLGSRTDLHIFDAGSVNGTRYCNEILLPYVRLFRGAMGLQFLFMDDNAPCHRTVAAEQLLESEDIERMDWLARSPDLNPIKHVWEFLGRRLAARTLPPVTIRELRLALQDEWTAMPQQLIDTLILSMGRRCETCLFCLAIHQNDHQARGRFDEWAQNEIAVFPDLNKRILFSDEAHFWLNGYVNNQNCCIRSEANPQVYVETPLHPEKLTAWCALWAGGIIGPYFFKNDEGHNVTVNGDRYRAMITNFFILELHNHDVQELWFQQDGATCHTARATIDLLKDTFGDRLISRFEPVNWPPRSCDLTPLDCFLWGYVKSLVYADEPQTLDHLEDNIRRVIADIRPQMLEKVIENWTSRLDYIRASRGSHMPEIIFKM
ncbi:transposable element Tcb2 transposase [Trichonephila clavipes]|uniref:Transposable element Tcb2 transposase n=1 Tax=Trichonephila clavipes TaxID=2585209 RepID=A0A8X6W467_TRICX|nr:transposable element Tcb2 transposase [Trichonephila clavipes]